MGLRRRQGVAGSLGRGRYRSQEAEDELATADEDLYSSAHEAPYAYVCERAGKVVPTADVTPDLGALRDVGADHLVRDAEQVVEQS